MLPQLRISTLKTFQIKRADIARLADEQRRKVSDQWQNGQNEAFTPAFPYTRVIPPKSPARACRNSLGLWLRHEPGKVDRFSPRKAKIKGSYPPDYVPNQPCRGLGPYYHRRSAPRTHHFGDFHAHGRHIIHLQRHLSPNCLETQG